MKTLYRVTGADGDTIGTYATKEEAQTQQAQHNDACVDEVYKLSYTEMRIRKTPTWFSKCDHIITWVSLPILVLICVGLSWFAWNKDRQIKGWEATTALIHLTKIEEETRDFLFIPISKELKITGSYQYWVGGDMYENTEMGIYTNEDVLELMEEDGESYAEEQYGVCYVNPANPEESALFTNSKGNYATYGLSAFLLLIGIASVFITHYSRKKRAFLRSLPPDKIIR